MELLAGINLAWTAVYILISLSLVGIYLRFGRNRDYLVFAVVCAELSVYSAARCSFYLATEVESLLVPGRVMLATLAPAAATLLHLAMRRAGVEHRTRIIISGSVHAVAVFFMVLSLAGGALDYSQVQEKSLSLVFTKIVMREYALSQWGLLMTILCLGSVLYSGYLLVKSYWKDPLNRTLISLAFTIMCLVIINDILLASDLIRSVYLLEHGFFFFLIGVLTGFLREFERSREQLRIRTEALQDANRNLERLAEDLSESTLRLDRVTSEKQMLRPMADLGRLSASLAHEIRNPLAVLSNVASTLRRHGDSARTSGEFEEIVQMMQEETDRLARLVDDLLLFAQSGRVSQEPVSPASVIELAVSDVREQVAGDVVIDIEVEPDLPAIAGSIESLRRAFVNLLTNAVQSSAGNGTVHAVARRNPDMQNVVMIGVEDSAGGVDERVMSDIFEPFFSTRTTGTGLGLPIVKSIVEAHDGDLVLENRPGKGASFWMFLPALSTRT